MIDVDLSDAVTPTVCRSWPRHDRGPGSDNAALAAMLTVTPGSIAANPGDANNLSWSFSSAPEAFDYLDDGESLTLTYTVRATDDSAAFDDQTVTITITGTNDAPVITVGAGDSAAETLAETNAALTVCDTLTVDRCRSVRRRDADRGVGRRPVARPRAWAPTTRRCWRC